MKKYLSKYGFYICIMCFAVSLLAAASGYTAFGNYSWIASMLLYLLFYIYLSVQRVTFSAQTVNQMLVISLLLCLFWDIALVHNTAGYINWKYFIVGFIPLHAALLYWGLQHRWKLRWPGLPLMLLMLVFIALTVGGLDNLVKWDELEYEYSLSKIKQFDFTPASIRYFSLCGHKTWGYALLAGIGEFLLPERGFGARMVQILMGLVTIYALEQILNKLLKGNKSWQRCILAAMFVCNPVFLSNTTYVSPDYAVTCFFLWMAACHLTDKKILQFFCSLLLCFSKETGILVCFFYYFGFYLFSALKEKQTKEKIQTFFFRRSIKEGFLVLLPPLLFLAVSVVTGGLWSGSGPSVGYVSGFRLEVPYIFDKSKTLFLINFQWILTALLLTAFVLYLLKNKELLKKPHVGAFLVSFIGLLGFSYLFVTYNHARYNLLFYGVMAVVAIYFAWYTVNKRLLIGLGTAVSILMTVQTFFTIDPITKSIFRKLDLGNGEIITTREEAYGGEYYDYSDSVVYNREYTYVDKTILQFLTDIEYDGTQLILFPHMTKGEEKALTAYCFLGEFEPFSYNIEKNGYWACYMDEVTHPDIWTGTNVPLNLIFLDEEPEKLPLDEYTEVYYVNQLCGYDFNSENILKQYQAEYFKTYTYRTASTEVYKIKG